jgi:DNA/RNA endonuclease YhcR with UshA esterase domain
MGRYGNNLYLSNRHFLIKLTMKHSILLFSLVILLACHASAQTKITPKEAAKHINEMVTVTGKIYSSKLIASNNMTLLDVGGFNPNQDLTVMIEGTNRSKFKGKPEEDYKGREVTITGKVIDFKGKPEIVVTDPEQIKLVASDNLIKIPAPAGTKF